MRDLNQLNDCKRCELCIGRYPVPGEGNLQADILVFGMNPSKEEFKQIRPFVGPSGKLLRKVLTNLGIHDRVYITNIVKGFTDFNADPTTEQIKACRPWLGAEILQIKPKIVISLGRLATEGVLKRKVTIGKEIGQTHKLQITDKDAKHTFTLIPNYHPAYLLRNGQKQELMDKFTDVFKRYTSINN